MKSPDQKKPYPQWRGMGESNGDVVRRLVCFFIGKKTGCQGKRRRTGSVLPRHVFPYEQAVERNEADGTFSTAYCVRKKKGAFKSPLFFRTAQIDFSTRPHAAWTASLSSSPAYPLSSPPW